MCGAPKGSVKKVAARLRAINMLPELVQMQCSMMGAWGPATAGAASVSTLLTIISKMPGCTAAMVSSTHAGPCFAASKQTNTTRHLVNLGVLLV